MTQFQIKYNVRAQKNERHNKAGKTTTKKLKLTSQKNPSKKYLIAVIDPDDTVKETNEDNNVVVELVPL